MLARLAKTIGLIAGIAAAGAPALREHRLRAPGFADFLVVDGATVWVTNRGRVEHWSRRGKLAQVALPQPCGAMAILAESLWVADCARGALTRIDLRGARPTVSIATGVANRDGETNVVAGDGAIWVASDDRGVIARVDPGRNAVVATISVDPGTWYLAYGAGSLWAVSARGQSLQRIDPKTNRVVGKTGLGREPGFLAVGEGGVWVQEQGDGSVARIDPASGRLIGRVKIGATLKWGDIDAGGGKVWLRTTEDQTLVVIDPGAMRVEARLGPPSGSGAVRYARGGVWTSAHDKETLSWWSC